MLRWSVDKVAVALVAASLFAGCNSVPIAETKAFSESVTAFTGATDPLLANLNEAERTAKRRRVLQRATLAGVPVAFNPADAPYLSKIGDVPNVATIRRSLQIVQDYAGLLHSLADGRRRDAAQSQILALAKNVDELVGIAGLSTVPSLAFLVDRLKDPIGRLLQFRSAAEARRLAIEGTPAVIELIEALRQAAPRLLEVLTIEGIRQGFQGDRAAMAAASKKNEFFLEKVADYVVLLDKLGEAFKQLVIAYQSNPDPFTLARLVGVTSSLAGDAKAFQTAFALRN